MSPSAPSLALTVTSSRAVASSGTALFPTLLAAPEEAAGDAAGRQDPAAPGKPVPDVDTADALLALIYAVPVPAVADLPVPAAAPPAPSAALAAPPPGGPSASLEAHATIPGAAASNDPIAPPVAPTDDVVSTSGLAPIAAGGVRLSTGVWAVGVVSADPAAATPPDIEPPRAAAGSATASGTAVPPSATAFVGASTVPQPTPLADPPRPARFAPLTPIAVGAVQPDRSATPAVTATDMSSAGINAIPDSIAAAVAILPPDAASTVAQTAAPPQPLAIDGDGVSAPVSPDIAAMPSATPPSDPVRSVAPGGAASDQPSVAMPLAAIPIDPPTAPADSLRAPIRASIGDTTATGLVAAPGIVPSAPVAAKRDMAPAVLPVKTAAAAPPGDPTAPRQTGGMPAGVAGDGATGPRGEADDRSADQPRHSFADPAAPLDHVVAAADIAPSPPAASPTRSAIEPSHPHGPAATIDHIEALRDAADALDTRIRLVPDALGTIDVTLHRHDAGVEVALRADQPATAAMLAEARPALDDLAAARGLRLVDTGGAASAGVGSGMGGGGTRPQPMPAVPPTATPRPAEAPTDPDPADGRIA